MSRSAPQETAWKKASYINQGNVHWLVKYFVAVLYHEIYILKNKLNTVSIDLECLHWIKRPCINARLFQYMEIVDIYWRHRNEANQGSKVDSELV